MKRFAGFLFGIILTTWCLLVGVNSLSTLPADEADMMQESVPLKAVELIQPGIEISRMNCPAGLVQYMVRYPQCEYANDLHDLGADILQIDYLIDEDDKEIYLFSDKYFDILFGTEDYTEEDLYEFIRDNDKLNDEYKDRLEDFTHTILQTYGNDMDFRIYGLNLKRVFIKDFVKDETTNSSTVAQFDAEDSSVAVGSNIDFEKDFYKHVIRHEFAHMFNNYSEEIGGYRVIYTYKYGFQGNYLVEGLVNYFVLRAYNDEDSLPKTGFGYPYVTAFVGILTGCMDYTFSDVISDNVYIFENKLSTMYDYVDAPLFEDTLELYHRQSMNYDETKIYQYYYDDMYYYLTRMYIDKYGIADMTEPERQAMKEQLLDRIRPYPTASEFDFEGLEGIDKAFEELN